MLITLLILLLPTADGQTITPAPVPPHGFGWPGQQRSNWFGWRDSGGQTDCDGRNYMFCPPQSGTCYTGNDGLGSGFVGCCSTTNCVARTTCVEYSKVKAGGGCDVDTGGCFPCTDSASPSCVTITNTEAKQYALYCAPSGTTQTTGYINLVSTGSTAALPPQASTHVSSSFTSSSSTSSTSASSSSASSSSTSASSISSSSASPATGTPSTGTPSSTQPPTGSSTISLGGLLTSTASSGDSVTSTYLSRAAESSPPAPPAQWSTGAVVGASIGGAVFVGFLCLALFWTLVYRRRSNTNPSHPPSNTLDEKHQPTEESDSWVGCRELHDTGPSGGTMVVVSQDASNADTSALGLGEARERAERERGHELDTFFEASLKTPELDSTPTSQQESFTDSADQESPALERARHRRIEEERQRREQAQDDIELLSGRAPSQASLSAAYFGSPTPRRGNQYLVFGEPPNSPQHNWSPISPVTQSSGSGGNRTSSVSAGPSRPRATYGGQMPGYQSAEDALARGLHDGSGTPF